VTLESSGMPGNIEVVVPGSPNDPFSMKNAPADQPATNVPAPASQPEPTKPLDAATIKALFESPEVKAAVESAVTERVTKAQSGLDKLNARLKSELESAKTQAKEAKVQSDRLQREVQMSNLSPQDREVMLKQYAAEDRLAEIESKAHGVDDYYKSVVALDLVNKYGLYGFTEEDIDEDDTPEEMEIKALHKQADFFSGKVPPAKPGAPASTSAPSDVGTGGPVPPEYKMGTEKGKDAMAANIRAKFARPERVL
jgi:hypothetical protein